MIPMPTLLTKRLRLEPLVAAHADELFAVLSDAVIYRYLDYGPPASADYLAGVYAQLEDRRSPDGSELWLNWLVRQEAGQAIGYIQATFYPAGVRSECVAPEATAYVAYVLSPTYWGQGYATEAMQPMLAYLEQHYAVSRLLAVAEVENERSLALLRRLGFTPAGLDSLPVDPLTPSERLYVRSN
jgi:[ribosomal protein S5]-alanine N-acetyltransferase